MSALLDKALSVVRALADDEQDDIARAMLSLASDDEAVEPIDPTHLPAVLEAIDQARRGEYAAPGVAEAALARFGK